MKKKSFTFIEMIIVISIVSLVVPSIFAIIFTLIREQVKIVRTSIIKREGDYALNLMINTIRNNAYSIHTDAPATSSNEICKTKTDPATPSAALYFEDESGNSFGYFLNNSGIASSSSTVTFVGTPTPTPTGTITPVPNTPTPTPPAITSSNTLIQNFLIGCDNTYAYGLPVVGISFDICYKTATGDCITSRPEESIYLHYQTKIRLRNIQ